MGKKEASRSVKPTRNAGKGKKKSLSERYFEALRKYPKACKPCEGVGWIWDEAPDAGDLDMVACPKCLEKGKCPVCGTKLPEDYEEIVMDMNPDLPDLECRAKKCNWVDGNDAVLPCISSQEGSDEIEGGKEE